MILLQQPPAVFQLNGLQNSLTRLKTAQGGKCNDKKHPLLYKRKMWCDEVPLQDEVKNFTKFIYSPLYSYSSEFHRSTEVKNYLLNVAVKGTVSVLMGLASASAEYQRKETTSSEREVISLSSSLYARKGFLVSSKEGPTYVDQDVRFKVEGMELGLEDILIVTTEVER